MQNNRQFFALHWLFFCAITFPLVMGSVLFAQQNNNQNNQNNQNQNQNNQNNRNDDPNRGGIAIDTNGVLSRDVTLDVGQLNLRKINIARASYTLPRDISAKSLTRCISLNRMEKSIIEAGGAITNEMMYLAGLQRITHVFYFPESKDIVIAGPAEGWFPGYEGTMIGKESLQPVCELQHLITALRAYAPNKEGAGIVGCSIDPTAEGNVRLQQFQAQAGRLTRQQFADGVQKSLGMQVIQVDGIPATTHAAQMMVAADYRMKRIGLGMDTIRVQGLRMFINHTVQNDTNALFRWYFVPDYESVIMTEDRTGIQLVGDGVKLVGENELVSETTGERTVRSGILDPGTREFTRTFTQQYPQIAKQALVFAQLRNWVDMLICAAHIQREDFYGKSGWSMEFFGNEEKYPLETFVAPKEVEPVVGIRVIGTRTLTPVGGGIVIDAEQALDKEHAKSDTDKKIANTQAKIGLNLPENVWWWDVR